MRIANMKFHLTNKNKLFTDEIIAIKSDETYQTVAAITDWDEYFSQTKEQLKEELESLKSELALV